MVQDRWEAFAAGNHVNVSANQPQPFSIGLGRGGHNWELDPLKGAGG